VEGAPELIVEIAASSASYDLHDKKRAYRRNGVQEYLVWLVAERTIQWFCLQDSEYVSLESNPQGVIESQQFPGLNLSVEALLAGDMARVLAVVQEGIATEKHQVFVDQLAERC
jgi:Uma2 family endonuclease